MAFDCFLSIDVIPGESTDDNHQHWIEVLSFDAGVSAPSVPVDTSAKKGAKRSNFRAFGITKTVDKASPKLMLYCANGTVIHEIKLELCRATGVKEPYVTFILKNSVISSYSIEGSPKGDEALPAEKILIKYGRIDFHYTEMDHKRGIPKGNVKTHWDLNKNKGGG